MTYYCHTIAGFFEVSAGGVRLYPSPLSSQSVLLLVRNQEEIQDFLLNQKNYSGAAIDFPITIKIYKGERLELDKLYKHHSRIFSTDLKDMCL